MHWSRTWSAVQGLWYAAFALALAVYPPGGETPIVVDGRGRRLPAHTTFFQYVFGSITWVILFGSIAMALVGCGLFFARALRLVHLYAMPVTYGFAVGYCVTGWITGISWALGAMAGATASAHIILARALKHWELY